MKKSNILGIVLLACVWAQADIFAINARLGKGVNLGNWGEAPNFDWGASIDSADIARIAAAGFQTIRVPLRWETRASATAPYTVDPAFFNMVDNVIRWGLANRLNVVINMHHHDSLFSKPAARKAQFLAIWGQIARRYRNYPDSLLFEILNEPHGNLTPALWNAYLAEALDTIRVSNPTRPVVIGSAEWGGIAGMAKLVLPRDSNLIFTVHYYEPYEFTHQGAEWASPVPPIGVTWRASYLEKLKLANDVRYIKRWAEERRVPVWVGEFGAYNKADDLSRHLWTKACARFFEDAGFSWSYWEFESGFGVWDPQNGVWRDTLLHALMDTSRAILQMDPSALGENMISNGDFSQGARDWRFSAWDGRGDTAVVEQVLRVNIDSLGQYSYGIQLTHLLPRLEEGAKYALLFDAWSDSVRILNYGFQNQKNWKTYSFSTANLTAEKSTYVSTFTMDSTDDNCALVFNFGDSRRPVFLDNVILVLLEASTSMEHRVERHFAMSIRVTDNVLILGVSRGGMYDIAFFSMNGRLILNKNVKLSSGINRISAPDYRGVLWVVVRQVGATSPIFTRSVTILGGSE